MGKRVVLAVGVSLLLLVGCASSQSAEAARTAQRLMDEGRPYDAASFWALASKSAPSNANLRYNHLYALYLAREYERVLEGADPAFERFPARLEFLRLKARALSKSGRHDEAVTTYRTLMELNPGDRAFLARVMEEAYASDLAPLAEEVATLLLYERSYEIPALKVLSALHPDLWYGAALTYLTHQD